MLSSCRRHVDGVGYKQLVALKLNTPAKGLLNLVEQSFIVFFEPLFLFSEALVFGLHPQTVVVVFGDGIWFTAG